MSLHILLVSDAWLPQVNGVVRTLQNVTAEIERLGHRVTVIGPDRFATVPLPGYAEIRLALMPGGRLGRLLRDADADAIHIATEGPLGWAARKYCIKHDLPFTTAYHTRFPEYVAERLPIPLSVSYGVMRRFHAPSAGVMVATQSIENDLSARGFTNLRRWSRGVDTGLFRLRDKGFLDLPRPILAYIGRLAPEKNLTAFLNLPNPGTKLVVGDGPIKTTLEAQYPDAVFVGARSGEDLASHYAAADVMVFPSRTDTFGLVILEALASGVPIAAYPVPGPLDIIGDAPVGAMDEDLSKAVARALDGADPAACRAHALDYSWEASACQFLANLSPFKGTPDETDATDATDAAPAATHPAARSDQCATG